MSSSDEDRELLHNFERDLTFLSQNLVPLKPSGKKIEKLSYEGSQSQHLTDEHVERLAEALLKNDKFSGPLKLGKNGLSDFAILALSAVLKKPDFQNITKLSLENNTQLTCKTGEYIGQALIENCEHVVLKELKFDGIDLGCRGLVRIIDAANKTPSLKHLNVGVLTDSALALLAERLASNKYLTELKFSETQDHQQYWSEKSRQAFCDLLKNNTNLKKVKAKFQKCNWTDDGYTKQFVDEIEFYTDQKEKSNEKQEDFCERMRSCEQEHAFQQMLSQLESKSKNKNMPVRNFYNNTFGQILNDAIFALKKKQYKAKRHGEEDIELQYHHHQIKFVADYILNRLPAGEMTVIDDGEESN